jgi:hypothetical protein
MLTIIAGALTVIAVALVACALFLLDLWRQGQTLGRSVDVQLKGLGDTHMQGFEALTIEVNKLQARAAEFEARLEVIEAQPLRSASIKVVRLGEKPIGS